MCCFFFSFAPLSHSKKTKKNSRRNEDIRRTRDFNRLPFIFSPVNSFRFKNFSMSRDVKSTRCFTLINCAFFVMLTRQLLKWLLLDSIYFVVYNIVFLNRASRESTAFQRHTHRQNLQSYILHRLDPFFSATFTIFSFQLNSLCVRGAN